MKQKTAPAEPTSRHSFFLPDALYDRLRVYAFEKKKYMTEVLAEALESFLAKKEKK